MPGFLGGSSGGSSGVGGEINFPKEFIDPVTKLRVSEPENLIDTDFEYGLQPTKWETVELINNTPSFFSKSGDTTIPNITAITTNDGTREITVSTGLPHGLAVGIPINVTGTKSITADGAYIINSIPNPTTFTYLCRDIQLGNNSIEDLYSSVITGEFFQGSQLRLADAAGITTDGESISTLTVTTGSTHGFYVDTPFYFLNLNSTISQEFPANNNEAKSFDASNSAVAQTFDGSNTLSQINIDWSNSATVAGVTSTVNMNAQNLVNNTITVAHGTENFANRPVGTPFYHDVVSGGGYFATNPRGVVFLKTATALGTSSSTFQVSAVPDGDVIEIPTTMTGTFQLANQARTFAGNNTNSLTEVVVDIVKDAPKVFDGANSSVQVGQVTSYSGSLVNVTSAQAVPLEWYFGAMVFYTTTGTAANGLTNNTTYFIDSFFSTGGLNYAFTLKPLPTGTTITSISGGTGTQTFKQIGVSPDKDIFHVKDHGYARFDMLRYVSPENGAFTVVDSSQVKNFYFVATVIDQHNFTLNQTVGELSPLTISRTGFSRYAITPTTVTAIGMTAPITYAVTSGTLPSGLSLNPSTGVVSGTPTENIAVPGRQVIITGTDVDGISAFQVHTYQFDQPPALYSFSSVTFTPGGAGGAGGPNLSQVRSGAGNPSWGNEYIQMPGNTGTFVWTVPEVATYRVEAYGAAGGWSPSWGTRGGYGTRMRGDFAWGLGDTIKMAIGQAGGSSSESGGGGGGTFVARQSDNLPYLVAGGGGGSGAGWYSYSDATTGTSSRGSNSYGGAGGGNGGNGEAFGGGGGFYGNGGGWAGPGTSFVNGAYGGNYNGPNGGFGGGGAGRAWAGGAGGGGGYAGGPGSWWSSAGGGAGSYNNGTNQSNSEVSGGGNGQISITRL
jgi:hypothetical protein